MNISPKVKDARIIINIKKELKTKIQEYAAKNGVTVTDLLTEFIESCTLKNKVEND
jgi:hypothetical protein